MKAIKISYWVTTIIFAGFMGFTAVPDVIKQPEAVQFIHGFMGYPEYFLPFIGWAKLLGAVALLIPGFPRIKEWAYAGMAYDLIAALYSMIALIGLQAGMLMIVAVMAVGAASYILHHKMLAASRS